MCNKFLVINIMQNTQPNFIFVTYPLIVQQICTNNDVIVHSSTDIFQNYYELSVYMVAEITALKSCAFF